MTHLAQQSPRSRHRTALNRWFPGLCEVPGVSGPVSAVARRRDALPRIALMCAVSVIATLWSPVVAHAQTRDAHPTPTHNGRLRPIPTKPRRWPTPPPALIVRPQTKAVPLRISTADIDVRIVGHLAETRLTLTFFNPNARVMEGDLYFPLPKGAVVSGYALDINGVLVVSAMRAARSDRPIGWMCAM